jgi:branched-chain amino acid transport system permease protein
VTKLIEIFINGLVSGGVYAILGVGFALIFGVTRMLNMAHTAFYMLAAFLILAGITSFGLPLPVAIVGAVVVTTAVGMAVFGLLYDRVKEHQNAVMIISVAVALLLQEAVLLVFGGHYRGIPPFSKGFVDILGARVSHQHLFAIATSGTVLAGLWLLLTRSNLGRAIRAVAQDREVANLMGIDISRILLVVMGISTGLAALAAAVVAPIQVLSPLMWIQPLTVVLASVVIGGLGSVGGSVIGAFVLGYTEAIVVSLLPSGGYLAAPAAMLILIVVLIIRPEGLRGVVFEEERI